MFTSICFQIILAVASMVALSAAAPAPKPQFLATPVVAPLPYVTATSSQVVARNYNALATPLAYSAPLVAAPVAPAVPVATGPVAFPAYPNVVSPYSPYYF